MDDLWLIVPMGHGGYFAAKVRRSLDGGVGYYVDFHECEFASTAMVFNEAIVAKHTSLESALAGIARAKEAEAIGRTYWQAAIAHQQATLTLMQEATFAAAQPREVFN